MEKKLLIKYIYNNCTDKELKTIVKDIKQNSLLNDKEKNWGKQEWDDISLEENTLHDQNIYNSWLDKIHHKININQHLNISSEPKKNRLHIVTNWITKAAAIILLPVLGILFYIVSDRAHVSNLLTFATVDSLEISTPIGSRTLVHLSDGSEVYLNYGSKIKYPQTFTGNMRGVVLSGEGYFKVAHNPQKPFIVKTSPGNINIKAVGTEFNVKSYGDNNFINTSLVKGKVIIEKQTPTGTMETIERMIPGQHISYNIETGDFTRTKGNIEKYIAWKEGKIIFENESIKQVTSVLSKMFNVDFEIKENAILYTYTVTFVDEPLFQILDLMKMATPINYTILPRNKLPDGTFSKQKIIIEKKN